MERFSIALNADYYCIMPVVLLCYDLIIVGNMDFRLGTFSWLASGYSLVSVCVRCEVR